MSAAQRILNSTALPKANEGKIAYLITFLGGCRSFHSVGRTLRVCFWVPRRRIPNLPILSVGTMCRPLNCRASPVL